MTTDLPANTPPTAQGFLDWPDTIVITGGNGWLGRRLVRSLTDGIDGVDAGLSIAQKAEIRCLVPAGEDDAVLRELGAKTYWGDVRDANALGPLFEGADGGWLIHLAGIIHPRWVREFEDINLKGTSLVLDSATRHAFSRAVIMSSNSPTGCNPSPDHRFTEDSPYNPYMGYGKSKMLMELAVRDRMKLGGHPALSIVRAPWFYGPGQPPRQTTFFQMVKDGKFPVVGSGLNKRSMGYVDSLTMGILLALRQTRADGEIFWLADAEPYTMNEIVETVGRVLSEDFGIPVNPPKTKLPNFAGTVLTALDASIQATGFYEQRIHVASELNKSIAADITKARTVLGYEPLVSLREGMRRSVDWCLKNGQTI